MSIGQPRVQVPGKLAAGEIFQVKALITHAMETGLRRDDDGKLIPRKIINRFVCRYGGSEVFSADLHESEAANPYFEFYVQATISGELEFLWEEDGGATARLRQDIVVG